MGITEPGFHVERPREVLVSGEFGSIVEGDGAARELGQAPEDSPQEPVSGLGCLALQRGGQGETRDALDQRQEVAALGAELQEVALPVAEFLTPIDGLWSLMDGAPSGDGFAPALEGAPSACRLGPRQEALELLLVDFLAVDEAVDRLVADLVL